MPAGWQAVANGAETARETAGDAAARPVRRDAADSDVPVRVRRRPVPGRDRGRATAARSACSIARPTQKKVARNRDAVFDLHASALDVARGLHRRSRISSASSISCSCRRSSSAAWSTRGPIFYNAASILLDESATENQMLGRASLIAHETAHMWFGDLVTMRWFNDVWMKEVFANFMAAKIVNPSFPKVNHELRFLVAHYPAAYCRRSHRGHASDPAGARQPERGRQPLRRRSFIRRRRSSCGSSSG